MKSEIFFIDVMDTFIFIVTKFRNKVRIVKKQPICFVLYLIPLYWFLLPITVLLQISTFYILARVGENVNTNFTALVNAIPSKNVPITFKICNFSRNELKIWILVISRTRNSNIKLDFGYLNCKYLKIAVECFFKKR